MSRSTGALVLRAAVGHTQAPYARCGVTQKNHQVRRAGLWGGAATHLGGADGSRASKAREAAGRAGAAALARGGKTFLYDP